MVSQSQGSNYLSEIGRRFVQIFWFQGEVLRWGSLLSICSIHLTSPLAENRETFEPVWRLQEWDGLGWIICNLTFFPTLFQSYLNNGRVIMKSCVKRMDG